MTKPRPTLTEMEAAYFARSIDMEIVPHKNKQAALKNNLRNRVRAVGISTTGEQKEYHRIQALYAAGKKVLEEYRMSVSKRYQCSGPVPEIDTSRYTTLEVSASGYLAANQMCRLAMFRIKEGFVYTEW